VVGVVTDIEEERQMRAQTEAGARLTVLGQMAASIAHEISQPLSAISIAAEITLAHLEPPGDLPKARTATGRILRQVERMRDIASHLRTFSRTDDGPLDDVPLEAAIEGALEVAGAALRNGGVVVELPDLHDLPAVQGRLIPLEQVLVNLLVNARDAMAHLPEGQRRLTLAIDQPEGADWLTIFVRDQGHGLPQGIVQHAFEPFFTTKPPGQGTGLGLSIAYGTIMAFGGEITLGNRPGGGAEVAIRLRLASAMEVEPPETAAPAAPAPAPIARSRAELRPIG
jgi:C4-dicarboxylate-specific signal transduction histidine kinase